MAAQRVSIGEFSALCGLTPRALRLYDEAGILVPAEVDPWSGYRYYDRSQVERAERIRLLRAAGLPVAGLTEILDADGDEALRRLAEHRESIEAAHEVAQGALSLVQARLGRLDRGDLMSSTTLPAHVFSAAVEAAARCCSQRDDMPGLAAIRLSANANGLELIATDSFSAAWVDVACSWDRQIETTRLVPGGFLLVDAPTRTGALQIEIDENDFRIDGDSVPSLAVWYPAVDRLLPFLEALDRACVVDAQELVDAIPDTDGPSDDEPIVAISADPDRCELVLQRRDRTESGAISATASSAERIAAQHVEHVRETFLSPARLRSLLHASGGQVRLALQGSPQPAVLANSNGTARFLLMPFDPDHSTAD